MDPQFENRFHIKFYKGLLLNKENYELFEKSGFDTIELIIFTDAFQIHKKTQIPLENIYSIQTNLLSHFGSIPINGYQYHLDNSPNSSNTPNITTSTNLNENQLYLSSGIDLLDNELFNNEGGFKIGEIYEFVGPSSSGKTQISMVSSFNCASINKQNVIYIDSSNSFSSNRLFEIYKSNQYEHQQQQQQQQQQQYPTQLPSINNNNNNNSNDNNKTNELLNILNRIKVINCFDSISLMNLLNSIESNLIISNNYNDDNSNSGDGLKDIGNIQFYKNLKLIIIDSIGTLLSPILGGKQTQGHFTMMSISRHLKAIANDYKIVFLITNNTVTGNPSGDNKAALAESWAVVSNHQLMINHYYYDDEDEERTIYIERSTRFKRKGLIKSFLIKDNGIF